MGPTLQPESTSSILEDIGLNFVLLAGGVGGAKLADGLAQVLPADRLTVIVNTGDDFRHLGLTICPDLDTVTYTLANVADPVRGWGRAGETWQVFNEIDRLGGPGWFKLGDRDLATHLMRSHFLDAGYTLTEATRRLHNRLGVDVRVLPMSDQPAATLMDTEEGILPSSRMLEVVQATAEEMSATRTGQLLGTALENADVVILAPSNPFVSIDPILNVYPIRAMITDLPDLVLAVSPIIAGEVVKGPAAKMMAEMGMTVTAESVSAYYDDLIDVFVCDENDCLSAQTETLVKHADIFMRDRNDRSRLAIEYRLSHCVIVRAGLHTF